MDVVPVTPISLASRTPAPSRADESICDDRETAWSGCLDGLHDLDDCAAPS